MRPKEWGMGGGKETGWTGKWRHHYCVPAGVSMHECGLRVAESSVCFRVKSDIQIFLDFS